MVTITDVLNQWNQIGVFSYVIPFLLVFAVVYAILEKSKILGDNKGVMVIVGGAIGLLSLQFDIVPIFFAELFPRFGVGLSIFLVFLVLIGFFYQKGAGNKFPGGLKGIAWIVAVGVVLWTLTNWHYWGLGGGTFNIGWWLQEYFWSLIILGVVIALVGRMVKGEDDSPQVR